LNKSFYPSLNKATYYSGIDKGTTAIIQLLAGQFEGDGGSDSTIKRNLPFGAIIFLIILFFVIFNVAVAVAGAVIAVVAATGLAALEPAALVAEAALAVAEAEVLVALVAAALAVVARAEAGKNQWAVGEKNQNPFGIRAYQHQT
jgi:uncharacterized membrane protein YgcG